MSERISILNEIRSGGYEASLITTFNAYLPFYEDVVLRHLMGSGIRHNVLMMDAAQATLAVDRHPPRSAGRLYTLVPVKVAGAFHPKVILLVGKKKGTLLIGSHNLTLSGFGYNREMTNVIRCKGEDDVVSSALLSSAWQQILGWAGSQAKNLPNHILEMVNKVQDFAPWLQHPGEMLPEDCRVIASGPGQPSLWQQLISFAGTGPTQRIIVSGAFFDANFTFVEQVRNELTPQEMLVGIDPASVQLPSGKNPSGIAFVNASRLGAEKDDKQSGYLHAKSLWFERKDGETVLAVGSANPSAPAWLAAGMTQNIEMMLVRKGAEAKSAAEELGLPSVASMPPLTEVDWQEIKFNWESREAAEQEAQPAQVLIALAVEGSVRFKVPVNALPETLACSVICVGTDRIEQRQARLCDGEYRLILEGLPQVSLLRFRILERDFAALVQHVRQIEGLSRTTAQRKFNEALSSLTTGMPNLEHFVDCIKDIIKISDAAGTKQKGVTGGREQNKDKPESSEEGAELSIGLAEVEQQEQLRKQRIHTTDELGYLLDVLLYHLRDESPLSLEDTLEDRDTMGRSEEEQVDADDEDDTPPTPNHLTTQPATASVKVPLTVCHKKVAELVGAACDKLDALKKGKLELTPFVTTMAGILSALRLLRGLDGKVSWVGAGQTAVPAKELRRLFDKLAEVTFDRDKSIIHLHDNALHLLNFDEFARLKGLIVWLAWESGINFNPTIPFNESMDARDARYAVNRHYVATAQLIAGDKDVIDEARQSIGQLGSSNMSWLDKLLAVDRLLRDAFSSPADWPDGTTAKSGDFGFNSFKPELGAREVLPKDSVSNRSLAFLNSNQRKFVFPNQFIRTISAERIFRASF